MADNGFATMAYIKQLIEEKQELQAKLDRAIRCIEFYAEPDTWQNYGKDLVIGAPEYISIYYDRETEESVCGAMARSVLKVLKGE